MDHFAGLDVSVKETSARRTTSSGSTSTARSGKVSTSSLDAGLELHRPNHDARGMAQMMRLGLYRPVHVKTLSSQKLRMLLTLRKLLQSKAIALENDLRGTLRNFGLKVVRSVLLICAFSTALKGS